jgi:HK97 family phage portal protein
MSETELDFEKRNMAIAQSHLAQMERARWTDWTLQKTVKEGVRASGWVFLANKLIGDAVSSAPLVVYNADGKIEWEHPVTMLLQNPHPEFSRADVFRLLASWLNLTGTGYFKKVAGLRGQTKQLWPISPDRLAPLQSKEAAYLIDGYEVEIKGERKLSVEYTPENVIRFCTPDPADPLRGLSPLLAASRAVDLDVGQQDWNKALLQNRGNPDIAITMKGDVNEQQKKSILRSIMSKFRGRRNAGMPLVLGGEAQVTRLGLSQQEMDFLASRKWNRDEILSIYGVPPQLAGAQESSTYNNFNEAKRVFWINTIIPLLSLLCDALNRSLSDELAEGYYIGPDLSDVEALSETQDAKLERAEKLFKMGVPMKTINERLELGLQEFEAWDKPWGGQKAAGLSSNESLSANRTDDVDGLATRKKSNGPTPNGWQLKPFEVRASEQEKEEERREKLANGAMLTTLSQMLEAQKLVALEAVEAELPAEELVGLMAEVSAEFRDELEAHAVEAGVQAAENIVIERRGLNLRADTEIMDIVASKITQERLVWNELALIDQITGERIANELIAGLEAGESIQQIQDRLSKGSDFSPVRALRISRTLVGSASSIGQLAEAEDVGCTTKTWITSAAHSRDGHKNRNGETVAIDAQFSMQYGGRPRWPLDQDTTAADRINCRCGLDFGFD